MTKLEEDLSNLVTSLSRKIGEDLKKDCETPSPKGYPYIPFCTRNFVKALTFIMDDIRETEPLAFAKRNKTFVDYGAGIGIMVDIASKMNFHATGIEINDTAIKYSERICQVEVYKGDLTNIKTFDQKEYDVVYFYCPFHEHTTECTFELNALNTVKIGGYVIAPAPSKTFHIHTGIRSNWVGFMEKASDTYRSLYKKYKNFKEVEGFNYLSQYILKRIK